ncbi:MAG: TetR/AcrR family transcriptional regulator [Xanthomonadales bacterium]|nr:TetR/AcrR family transcriptional regulator [Xanthomonadales bacterium]
MTAHDLPKTPAITVRKAPKQQRSRKLVEAILEAAARILEQATDPFTTNHIAKLAGVSIGSLYQYFPSAEAIMAALIEQHVADEQAAAAEILATTAARKTDVMRDLLVAFVNAHADAPRLTARLHALAPSFNLHEYMAAARDEQALQIAQALGLPAADIQMSVMAVEGVVLATLASDPEKLKSSIFIDKLYAIALSPLGIHP